MDHVNKNDGRVVSNFVTQALEGKDITLYGDGDQTRSFCYYSDLIDGLIRLMNSKNDITGPVNLGNPTEISIKSLSEIVLSLIPESKSKIVFETLPMDDPKQRKPDITRAAKYLGWKPKVELTSGLIETIDFFKSS